MIRILLADDQVVVRRGLRVLIEARSDFMICAEAGTGREAVALAVDCTPDVVVLDIALPLLNGIDATRQIRRASPATEVLIFTSHDGEEVIRDAVMAGARGYVLKSEPDEQIIKAIATLAQHQAFFSSQVWDIRLDTVADRSRSQANLLTSREREIVQLVAEGNSNKKIAKMLVISVKTVETHRAAAMHKLNIHSTADLVRYAVRTKLVEP